MNYADNVFWVTGASSGIGYATVLEFVRKGARSIAISGRNIEKLEQLKKEVPGVNCYVLPFDVCDRSANLQAVQKIKAHFGALDVIFLNAGGASAYDVQAFDSADVEQGFRLNFFSLLYGIEAALPLLRQSQRAQIIGMSSVAGYGGLGAAAAYCAAKAAARVFLEGLTIDLLPENIAVSIVCPGFVKTPLTDRHQRRLPLLLSTQKAAMIIVRGIEKQRAEIHFPKRLSLLVKCLNLLPAKLYTRIVAKLDTN